MKVSSLSQTIDTTGGLDQCAGMCADKMEDTTRKKLARFIARQGHGAIKDLAVAVGVHPRTVTRYHKHGAASPETISKLARILANEVDPMPKEEHDSPNVLLARRLRLLADTLESPFLAQEQKRQEFVGFIEACHEGLAEWSALLEKH
jgi:hypothetical protein